MKGPLKKLEKEMKKFLILLSGIFAISFVAPYEEARRDYMHFR